MLQPWVTFFVMPAFALANAGVSFSGDQLGDPVQLAVSAGLLLGKPLGIVAFSWGAVRLGLAELPEGRRRGCRASPKRDRREPGC